MKLKWILLPMVAALGIPVVPVYSQAIHLPPMYTSPIARGTPLLTIKFDSAELASNPRVGVHDDQLVLFLGNGQEIYPLGNSTLIQLANALEARHENAQVFVTYPFAAATNLGSAPVPVEPNGDSIVLSAGGMTPRVDIGFGIVFAMADDGAEADTDDGLLDQTGFQLDLVGSHLLRGSRRRTAQQTTGRTGAENQTRESRERWDVTLEEVVRALTGENLYAQLRLGLNSDQRLNVTTTATTDGNTAGTQVETAIVQADQIALTGQLEFVWPVKGLPVEASFVPEYGVSWTRPEAFVFPRIPQVLGGTPEPSEAFFDANSRTIALRQLNSTFPLSTYGWSVIARFRRENRIGFYAGGGRLWQELIRRGIRFGRDQSGRIVPASLRPVVDDRTQEFWRAMFGVRLGGVVDLRVDAIGPLGNRQEHPPILRLVLIRDFPLRN